MALLPHLVFLVGVCQHEAPAGGEWRVLDVLPAMPQAKVGRGHGEDGCDKMLLFQKNRRKETINQEKERTQMKGN